MQFNNLIIFNSKKQCRAKTIEDNIYFSLTKNKKGYTAIRFYFSNSIAAKYGINETVRIRLACLKDNHKQWCLIIDNGEGYTIRKAQDKISFSCLMNFPFEFVENKRMQYILEKNIKYDAQKRMLMFSVDHIFLDNTLI